MRADKLLAKLGTKAAPIPGGQRRSAHLKGCAPKTLGKVKRALGLQNSGIEPMTRAHGSQTQSMDYDAMTPQDIAAAAGFISDPLAREVFCIARWPNYYRRTNGEAKVLVLRKLLDEAQRRHDEYITAWLKYEMHGDRVSLSEMELRKQETWPAKLEMYPRIVKFLFGYADGSGLPDSYRIAKGIGIARSAYFRNWRNAVEWAHEYLTGLVCTAERQFLSALQEST